jgi:N-methylhydantoinase B
MSGVRLDPVTFEVLRHRLWEINDEMGLTVGRVSGSTAVYEAGDFNTAILTPDGQGLYAGVYVIRQASALDVVVQKVIEVFGVEIDDGDAFMTSDPWYGALHAMDTAVVAPVFFEGRRVAWTGVVIHELDMGGPHPGSWCVGARNAYQEVPLIPPVKIVERGRLRRDVEAVFLRNSRTPEVNALNLRAKLAAQAGTRERLLDIIREYGVDTFLGCQEQILDYVRRSLRARIASLPDGTWYATAMLDHNGVENRIYRLKLALTKRGDRLCFDFTGTSPQAEGCINCTWSGLVGGILQVAFPLLCYDLPWSHGAVVDCIDIVSTPGTINNAIFPAGTSMATVNACQSTGNLVWEAMARMYACGPDELKREVMGLGYGGLNTAVIAGRTLEGRSFVTLFSDAVGGGGARSFADGVDTCSNLIAPAYSIPNVERIETLNPLLYVYRKERAETAGAGKWRGGVGIEYVVIPHGTDEALEAVFIGTGVSHMESKGVHGGAPGTVQRNVVLRATDLARQFAAGAIPVDASAIGAGQVEVAEAKDVKRLHPGDAWLCFCMGGGGYGDPLTREPALVARDVRRGLVTRSEADRNYAVTLAGTGAADLGATAALRAERRRGRLARGRRLGPDWDGADAFAGRPARLRIGEVLEVREGTTGLLLGCGRCERLFGPAGEDPRARAVLLEYQLSDLSPVNRYGLESEIVVRAYCCPACGAQFSTDVQFKDEDPRMPEMHLAF